MSVILTNQPPVNKRFKICFKSFFESIPVQKVVSEVLKTLYFSYSAFWFKGQWGAIAPPGCTAGHDPTISCCVCLYDNF